MRFEPQLNMTASLKSHFDLFARTLLLPGGVLMIMKDLANDGGLTLAVPVIILKGTVTVPLSFIDFQIV